jgi:hypothetical protein
VITITTLLSAYYFILPIGKLVFAVRKKTSIAIDEELLTKLQKEADKKNMSLSRLIENKLKGIE